LQEGQEEIWEGIAEEMNKQVANVYNYWNDNTDPQYFTSITDDGYWGDLANNLAFSGVIGFGMGAMPGLAKDVKRIANRKAKDVHSDLKDSYVDIITNNEQDKFVTAVATMRKNGSLGSESIRADKSEGIVDNMNMSQAEFNEMVLLNDLYITAKTLGEQDADDNIKFAPTDANIDVAKKTKKTYNQLMDIYAKNDIVYEDYKAMRDHGLAKFNKARNEKGLKTVGDEDYKQLDEGNNFIQDVKSGMAHRIAFMEKAVENDNIFGNSESRHENLQDSKFDNLIYKYFKGVLTNVDIELENKRDLIKALDSIKGLKVNGEVLNEDTPIESIVSFIDKYAEKGVIEPKEKALLEKKTKEYLLSTKEFNNVKVDIANSLIPQMITKTAEYINTQFADIKLGSFKEIDAEINRLSTPEKSESGTSIPITDANQTLINRLNSYKKALMFSDKLSSLSDEEKLEIGMGMMVSSASRKNADIISNQAILTDGIYDKNTFSSLNSDGSISMDDILYTYELAVGINDFNEEGENHDGPSVKETPITELSKSYAKFEETKNDLFTKVYSLSTENKEQLERSMSLDISYLDKILKVRDDNGEVMQTGLSIGSEMRVYLNDLMNLLPDERESKSLSDEQSLLLIKDNQNELYEKTNALFMHMRFIDILSNNLRGMNYVNNIINRSRKGELLQLKKKPGSSSKAFQWLSKNFGFTTTARYKVNDDFANTERTLKLKDVSKRIEDLESKLISEDKLSDEQKVEIKDEIDILKAEFPYNIFDNDRKVWLMKNEKSLSVDERKELSDLKSKEDLLKSPSIEMMTYLTKESDDMLRVADEKHNKLITEYESLVEEVHTMEPNAPKMPLFQKRIDVLKPKVKEAAIELEAAINTNKQIAEKKLDDLKFKQKAWEQSMQSPSMSQMEYNARRAKEPFLLFFRDIVERNNNTVRKQLGFFDKFFSQDGFTIKDKSVMATVLFDILATEEVKAKRAGVGANYEGDVKRNFNNFVEKLTGLLSEKEKELKCTKA